SLNDPARAAAPRGYVGPGPAPEAGLDPETTLAGQVYVGPDLWLDDAGRAGYEFGAPPSLPPAPYAPYATEAPYAAALAPSAFYTPPARMAPPVPPASPAPQAPGPPGF